MRHRRVVVKLVATSRPGRSPTTPPPVVVTDAGVRDQQVDLAGLLDRAVHRARVGDIELHPASATQGRGGRRRARDNRGIRALRLGQDNRAATDAGTGRS